MLQVLKLKIALAYSFLFSNFGKNEIKGYICTRKSVSPAPNESPRRGNEQG